MGARSYPHWAPSSPSVNSSSPPGICCEQAPPETSRTKREKPSQRSRFQKPLCAPGKRQRKPHHKQVSKSPPTDVPSLNRAGTPLSTGVPETRAPCKEERTDTPGDWTAPPQGSDSEHRPENLSISVSLLKRGGGSSPNSPQTDNLCP